MSTIIEEITLLSKAKYPILWVQTSEETRLGRILNKVSQDLQRDLLCWTSTEGLRNVKRQPVGATGTKDISIMLDEIRKLPNASIILVKDPHKFLQDVRTNRKFRDTYNDLKNMKITLVISSPVLDIPVELVQEITVVKFALPDEVELGLILDEGVDGLKEQAEDDEKAKEVHTLIEKQLSKNRVAIIRAMMGLTSEKAGNIIAKCIAMHSIDINEILKEKQQAIRESGALEFYPAENNIEVGGLKTLKTWLDYREIAFSPEAEEYGLPAPKGVILYGIPGTGKSLVAKSLAARWNLPLIRLDVGSLFGSLVGQSEDRTRQALAMVESIAPVILWVDEIEKAFSFGSGDNGTSQRVFATILTWMQEKKKPCFLIATANNISALPPELQRKGRFDEIFFLDLPNGSERKEIFTVHLKKRKFNPKDFNMDELVKYSDTFVGAEIEQSVIDAMYVAFSEKKRKITTEDIVTVMKKIVPMAKSQGEAIETLRTFLREGRAISASEQEVEKKKSRVEI
jgi:SpoVK/Ycf46/Vps4 family AAA+-type ATPase